MDTIFAVASGAAPTAIAVVRISGPETPAIVGALTAGRVPAPRQAALRALIGPDGAEIDRGLVLTFEEGRSYTGEASAELQLHGGPAILTAATRALERFGARPAGPGEFSRRALANGRMDLAQAEGLSALIAAETEAQRRHALRVLEGAVGRLAAEWREALVSAIALLETGVDFVEEDLGEEIQRQGAARIGALRAALQAHLDSVELEDKAAALPHIALIGPPNAGKSSLLNAIAGRDAAIVTEIAGTTRDAVSLALAHGGQTLSLVDTAGLRETADPVESIGVERAREAARRADHRIFVLSADTIDGMAALRELVEPGDALFWNKSDLDAEPPAALADFGAGRRYVVSTRDGSARQAFAAYLDAALAPATAEASPIAGSERRKTLAQRALAHLIEAETAAADSRVELAIEELRRAWAHLDGLVGAVDHEAVLDEVFSRFCIGK